MKTVDISVKFETLRTSRAYGRIKLKKETVRLIKENKLPKGNLIEATKLAGIFGAKRTGELLPFCHPIPLDFVSVEVKVNEDNVEVFSEVRGIARTGYEMEALTAVSVALLNIYDMCKGFDESMVIEEIKLLEKKGGKSDWRRTEGVSVSVDAEGEIREFIYELLKREGYRVSENGNIKIVVSNTLRKGNPHTFESVVSLYLFVHNPKEIADEVRIFKENGKVFIVLPENKEKIAQFFKTFGGILGNLLK